MKRHALVLLLGTLANLALAMSPVLASFNIVPLEILVDEADLIIAGKVTKIENGFTSNSGKKFEVAVVKVTGIVKSLVGKPKEVCICTPWTRESGTPLDIRYSPGQESTWVLRKDPERNVYWPKGRSLDSLDPAEDGRTFQYVTSKLKEMADLVAAREKLPRGKAVAGLVARAELFEHKREKEHTSYAFEIRFSLKNGSEKPITICTFPGHYPLEVEWTGPDTKKLDYKRGKAEKIVMTKDSFVTIPPGGVRFLGGATFYSRQGAAPHDNIAQVGLHQVAVSFVGKQAGKEFGIENVWLGTVTGNEITFMMK